MKPTLETCGPLQVPVDETGTAVGMPEDTAPEYVWTAATMAEINRLTPDIDGKAFEPGWFLLRQRLENFAAHAEDLRHALERLAREARMFRDYGYGREHLTNAILDAQRVLDGGAL